MSKSFTKFKQKFGRVVVTTAALIVTLSTMIVNAQTVSQTTDNLNLRQDASTKSKILKVIPKGDQVNVLSKSEDWSKVSYEGKTGYVSNKYLEKVTVKSGKVNVGNSRLNVRNKASLKGDIIGKLYTEDKVTIKGETGNWYKIDYKSKVGYVSKAYIKVSTTEISEVEKCEDVLKAQIGFNVRKGPSTSHDKIGRIVKGQVLQVQGKCSNGWYQIKYGNKIGYISPKYLDEKDKGTTDPMVIGTAKVNTKSQTKKNLYIREEQATDSTGLELVATGTTVEVIKDSNPKDGWTKVRYNNLNGYASTKYLELSIKDEDDKPSDDEQKPPVVEDEAPVISSVDELELTVGDNLDLTSLNLEVTDKEDGNITKEAVVDTSKVDTTKAGTYVIVISVKDSKGNEASKEVKVIVKEKEAIPPTELNEAPTISSVDSVELEIGQDLDVSSLNLKATDKEDGDITADIIIDTTNLDASKAGEYTITLSVTDSQGATTSKEIKVVVKEKEVTPPEVTDEAPVLTADNIELTVGDKFDKSMLNIKAEDKEDGDITADVVVDDSELDTTKAGVYKVYLRVLDSNQNQTVKVVQVTVKEKEVVNTKPTISAQDVTLEFGQEFDKSMLNIVANDAEDGNLAGQVRIEGTVNTSKAGKYELTLTVEDKGGLTASTKVTVTVKEKANQAPTITANDITLEFGAKFDKSMLNIVATDEEDGNITKDVIVTGEVNTSKAGTYTLTLTVTDSKGDKATKTVKVTVKEKANQAPTISAKDVTITEGDSFSRDMLQIVAEDEEYGNLAGSVVITGEVNAMKAGTYELTLTVTDSKGAKATTKVTVTVKAKEVVNNKPVISAQNVTITIGSTFDKSLLNISATDKEDGNLTGSVKMTGTVNTNKVGTYNVTLTVSDSKGATATKTVTVTVKATKPVVYASDVTIEVGDTLSNSSFKASATDCEGTNLDVSIDKSAVNTAKAGTYNVTISATDKWSNTTTKTVTVTVKEKAPVAVGYDINSKEARAIMQQEMYRLVNELRAANGRTAYKVSGAMENTAWVKSKDMGDKNYFDHTWNGQDIWEYTDAEESVLENIAKRGFYPTNSGRITEEEAKDLAQKLFGQWEESAGHKASMLSKDCKSIGFDVYMVAGRSGYIVYATQEFDF